MEMDIENGNVKFMDFNIKSMTFQGLWRSTDNVYGWRRWVRYLYPRFLVATALYNIFITHAIDVYKSWGKKLYVIENIILICIYIMTVVQVATFVLQAEGMQKLVHDLGKLYNPKQYFDSYHRTYLQDTQIFCHKLSTHIPILINILLLIFVVTTLFHLVPQRMLYFRGWYPFDALATPDYQLMLLYSITIILLVINSLGIGDMFFVVLLVLALRQFRCLSYKLEHLRKFAKTKVLKERRKAQCSQPRPYVGNSQPPVVRTVYSRAYANEALKSGPYRNKLSNLALLKPLQQDVYRDTRIQIERFHETAVLEVRSLRFEAVGRIKKLRPKPPSDLKKRIDDEMIRLLVDCVQHHQDLLRVLTDITEMFNPVLIYQFICNLAGTGLLASYASQQSSSLNSKTIGMMELLFVCICKLFLFCFLANRISDESSYVRDAVYGCDWFDTSEDFKRLMRVMMSRANNPTLIKAFAFVPLSLEVFGAVTKTAYSYFTILDKAKTNPPHHKM